MHRLIYELLELWLTILLFWHVNLSHCCVIPDCHVQKLGDAGSSRNKIFYAFVAIVDSLFTNVHRCRSLVGVFFEQSLPFYLLVRCGRARPKFGDISRIRRQYLLVSEQSIASQSLSLISYSCSSRSTYPKIDFLQ